MVLVMVIERLEGRYEIEDMPFGTIYRWSPECVVIKCDCSQRLALSGSTTTCGGCGMDHAPVAREKLAVRRQEKNESIHPWRSLHYLSDTGRPV
jgi:hypothetical protein